MAREPKCSVGYGGGDGRTADEMRWVITWLPKGYGPSLDMFDVCRVACPPDEDWKEEGREYGVRDGERPPLVQTIVDAIEEYMKAKSADPGD